MFLYNYFSSPMPSSSVTNYDRSLVVSSVISAGSIPFLAPRGTIFLRRCTGNTCTVETPSTPPGHTSSTDTPSIPSPPSPTNKHNLTTYQQSSRASWVATTSYENLYTNRAGTSLGSSTSTPIMPAPITHTPIAAASPTFGPQSVRYQLSTTITSSKLSQSPSQASTPSNQSSHTTSVGLIAALTLVGGLFVALMTYLTLRYRRRIHRRRSSSPLINSVLSRKQFALSLLGGLGSRVSRPTSPSMTIVIEHTRDRSASASAGVSPASDTSSCESTFPQDSQPDARFSRTPPSSKIGLAL
ncbi:hypothetical protein EDC04DRAFT_157913 [Pisolithus marmoratus]|nr:hypothetical protein EDC04DRAFT_157913 [Pisolithus marmoratus]